ncbi:DNA adenine methylase [Candidatus Daviesbacteria bacterium]|nr:DNA adenine methylase [Candidatus Daviesbacteria bacterium]
MGDFANSGFRYPSTRYTGSKRRFLEWIKENSDTIKFDTVLDLFGGTASVSLLFKRYGKQVSYNDFLASNQIVAKAIVENDGITISDKDLASVFSKTQKRYPNFIQNTYKNVFFLDEENAWLDQAITNINKIDNEYKRAILMASLFQACLAKRPFNLFHRANLYIRTNDVKRTFCNKTTWERSFEELVSRYVKEYNNAVFSNKRNNRVIGGYNAAKSPNGVDLVYMDPPYFSEHMTQGTNYLAYYHFLEGLADYKNWKNRLGKDTGKVKRMEDSEEVYSFTRKDRVLETFEKLIKRFQHTQLIISYQSNGIPSKEQIIEMLHNGGKKVKVYEKPHKYALSRRQTNELLFVAT